MSECRLRGPARFVPALLMLVGARCDAEIVLLASAGSSYDGGIAVTAQYIYYAPGATTNDRLRRVVLATGATEEIATVTYTVTDLLYRGGQVYISYGNYGGGGVCRVDEVTLAKDCFSTGYTAQRLSADTTYLYWGAADRLCRMQLPFGDVELLTSQVLAVTAVAPWSDWVYFTRRIPSTSARQIARVPAIGGEIQGLEGTSEIARDMLILNGRVYWIEKTAGLLMSVDLDGSGAETLLSGLARPNAMDSDGRSLFILEQGTAGQFNGRLLNVSLSGEVHVLAQGLDYPRDVAVRGTDVYWNDNSGFRRYCPGLCGTPDAAAEPTLLIHGLASNATTWSSLAEALEAGGLSPGGFPQYVPPSGEVINVLPGDFYAMNFSDAFEPFPAQNLTLAEQGAEVGRVIAAIRTANPGVEKVKLVGHSMGGLAARAYLQGLAADGVAYAGDVSQLVTIGTPHRGSMLAAICADPLFGPLCLALAIDPTSPAVGELEPGSSALAALNDLGAHPLPAAPEYAAMAGTGRSTFWISELLVDGDGVVPLESQDPQILVNPWPVVPWNISDREDCGAAGLEVHTCEPGDPFIMDSVLRMTQEMVFGERFEGGDFAGWSVVTEEAP